MDVDRDEVNWTPKGSNGWGPLHLVAACGDMKGLVELLDHVKERSLLENGERPDGSLVGSGRKKKGGKKLESRLELVSATGDRAFHVALRNGQALAARELARAGCEVRAKGKNGETAAHICAALDLSEEILWMMKNHDLDPTALTDRGETIIHFAAENCRISFLEWVVKQPFGTYDFMCKIDKHQNSCLHSAATTGIRVGVRWLLNYFDMHEMEGEMSDALSPFSFNSAGKDPIMVARSEGHYSCAQILEEFRRRKIKERKARRQTLKKFFDFARENKISHMKNMLRKRHKYSLVDMRHHRTQNTVLMEACEKGHLTAVKFIFAQKGERELVNRKSGVSVLHLATQVQNIPLVKYLLVKGMDPTLKDGSGHTPFMIAKHHHNEALLAALMNKDGDQGALDSSPMTPPRGYPGSPKTPRSTGSMEDEFFDEPPLLANHEKVYHRTKTDIRKQELKEWLIGLDMLDWFERLCEEGFDSLKRVINLTEEDLRGYGMKKGYIRSFMRSLEELEEDYSSGVSMLRTSPMDNKIKIFRELSKSSTLSAASSSSGTSDLPASDLHTKKFNKHVTELADGEEVVIDGHTRGNKYYPNGKPRQYILRRTGKVLSCTCAEWKLQMLPLEARTCVHLKDLRGQKSELRRIDNSRKRMFNMVAIREELQRRIRGVNETDITPNSERPASNRSGSAKTSYSGSSSSSKTSDIASASAGSMLDSQPSVNLPAHQILSYEELTFGQIIGEGSFGVVRAAEWRGMLVAVKELRGNEKIMLTGSASVLASHQSLTPVESADLITPEAPSKLERQESSEEWDLNHEAAMMSRVSNHENIVPFVGVLLTPKPCVVTKLMRRGSVEDLLVVPGPLFKRNRLTRERVIGMMIDAAAGILHLHHEGVIHRDIAARNLLVDENFTVRVADFGFARIKEMNRSKGYTNQHVGPIKWMSPEAMRFRTFSELSDVYSFGCALFEVAAGKRPWEGIESMDVVFRVCRGERLEIPENNSFCCSKLRELIERCQAHEPSDRPTMKEVHKGLQALRENPPTTYTSQSSGEAPKLPKPATNAYSEFI
mmetsp:Transcript_9267/g.15058  ORF Transcript_9267/g.15058 Transcript_9267/m.15058 type:complete len:1056 (+) Transcript_9267:508-3675(+)